MGNFGLIWCKSVSIQKQNTGMIRINATFLSMLTDSDVTQAGGLYPELLKLVLNEEVSLFNGFPFICTSLKIDGIYKSITLVNKYAWNEEKLTRQIVMRSVPLSLYDAASHSVINNYTIPNIDNPEVEMHIDTKGDAYGVGGFTTQDVLAVVGNAFEKTTIDIPGITHYDINDITLNVGSTMMQIVQNLFPIPGLCSSYTTDGDLIIKGAPDESSFNSFITSLNPCMIVSKNIVWRKYYYIVEGSQSSPEKVGMLNNIQDISSNNFQGLKSGLTWNIKVIYNLFGGIFGFSKQITETSKYDKKLVLPQDISDTMLTL